MTVLSPLQGRHALVTGGARGIGLACAQALGAQGAVITLMGRQAAGLQAACEHLAAAGVTAGYVCGDVARQGEVEQAFAAARAARGPLHILVNNAGQAISERFDRTSAELWQQMLQVNLSGVFHCAQAALPDMLQAGWGRVINVASTAGLLGYAYVSAYCAAKHGVVGLTRALAQEVARKGVTVNAVCPGYTETDIVRDAVANIIRKTGLDEAAARARLAQRNPQGRLVQPQEVADTVAWLALPASASVNGQAIAVDGGETAA